MKRSRYTAAEIAIIRERFPHESAAAIAADLDRGAAGVASMAYRLGLTKANRRRPASPHELDEIRRRYPDEPAADIARDLDRSAAMIYYRAGQMKLSKSPEFLKRMADQALPWDNWPDDDLATLTARYANEKTETIARDLKRTVRACYGMAKKLGLRKSKGFNPGKIRRGERRGRKYEFKPGNVPANKGLRRPGFAAGRMAETQFKKGHKNNTEFQVGDISSPVKHGRAQMHKRKMCMTCKDNRRWMSLPRYLWMMAHGPIPPGHVVRCNGWDPDNPLPPEEITLDRLECITLAENARRNSIHNLHPELVKTIRAKGVLTREIKKQRRQQSE